MTDPYTVLGVPPDAGDAAIREAYLALARQFTPENHPERFTAIRKAYDTIRDLERRARHRLLEQGKDETIDAILEDAACRTQRRRPSLDGLIATLRPPA
jgi:curved DNA-binding protein CbpA